MCVNAINFLLQIYTSKSAKLGHSDGHGALWQKPTGPGRTYMTQGKTADIVIDDDDEGRPAAIHGELLFITKNGDGRYMP